MIIAELDTSKCSHCGNEFKHSKYYKLTKYRDLKEVELLHCCCVCRFLFRRQKELHKELLNIEWDLHYRKK